MGKEYAKAKHHFDKLKRLHGHGASADDEAGQHYQELHQAYRRAAEPTRDQRDAIRIQPLVEEANKMFEELKKRPRPTVI